MHKKLSQITNNTIKLNIYQSMGIRQQLVCNNLCMGTFTFEIWVWDKLHTHRPLLRWPLDFPNIVWVHSWQPDGLFTIPDSSAPYRSWIFSNWHALSAEDMVLSNSKLFSELAISITKINKQNGRHLDYFSIQKAHIWPLGTTKLLSVLRCDVRIRSFYLFFVNISIFLL